MSQTQLASMFLGNPFIEDRDQRLRGVASLLNAQIHITDGQTGEILDYITAKNIIEDNHKKSLVDTLETYDFITFSNKRYAQHLEKRNRIIIPDEDETLREFVIFESIEDRIREEKQVFAHASYLELKKASIIYPDTYEGSASQHASRFSNNTGWQVGIVEGQGTRTITVENHTNPYEMYRRLAREFDLELRFRVEHDGNRITGRYIDLLERVGEWQGREVDFGKDLDGIRRIEKQDIVTALLGLGPEDENGNRLEVLVEDEEALQRWGRVDEYGNLHHLIEPYEIQSSRLEMTEQEAIQYTRTALDKRINTQIEYETTIIDLEHVPGLENKRIRFGDTIRIKDTHYDPPLYLEARVFEQNRSIKSMAKKEIKLGDYVEFTEDEVHAVWNQLRNQIREKISHAELVDYTYNKLTIDNKDQAVRTDVESYANTVSSDAKDEAITYTNNTINPIRVKVENLEDEVDDQGGKITQAQTDITQAWNEIELKASQTYVNTIEQRLETAESTLQVLPDQINAKVDDGQARSIFQQEASSFTFSADQINFDGHVFGSNATFTGHLEGVTGTFRGNLNSSHIVVGSESISSSIHKTSMEFKMPVRITDGEYVWGDPVEFRFGNHSFAILGQDFFHVESATSIGGMLNVSQTLTSYGTIVAHKGVDFAFANDFNNGIEFPNNNIISVHGNELSVYGNRSSGRRPFKVRSHSNRSSLRDDFWINSDGNAGFAGRLTARSLDVSDTGTSGGIQFPSGHFITPAPNGNFYIYGNRGSGYPFAVRSHENKSGYRNDFFLTSDGFIYSPPTYNSTTTNSANIRVGTSAGLFSRNTSLREYKLAIESYEDPYKILELEARTWFDKNNLEKYSEELTNKVEGKEYDFSSVEYLKRTGGLIAEEVVEAGLETYASYDEEGNLVGVDYDRLWTLLIPIVRDLKERLDEIEQRSNV